MSESRSETSYSDAWVIGLTLVGVLVLLGFWLTPFLTRGIYHPKGSPDVQTARMIGLSMFSYANDHSNKYPTGKSSTEVFQKLLDEKYISNPAIFYCRAASIPGKVKAISSKLVPANVCWDVTADLDLSTDPDELPVVFLTGYRVQYAPGGSAMPLPSGHGALAGLFITFKNNSCKYMGGDLKAGGIVRDIILPTTVFPTGKKYQQLTPDGPLAP